MQKKGRKGKRKKDGIEIWEEKKLNNIAEIVKNHEKSEIFPYLI